MIPTRVLTLLSIFLPAISFADEVLTVAVASNFQSTARDIVTRFTESTDIPVRLSAGSTGKLFAQIVNGAPYDIFLAADAERPRLLEASGDALPGSLQTYAIGSLVLWSADPQFETRDCRKSLRQGDFKKLAIANPKTAPYGDAAHEFLRNAGLLPVVEKKLVYGENISQALNFVATGNATLGLIAASQAAAHLPVTATCSWPVPSDMHGDLQQQAVVLSASQNIKAARRFMNFLQSDSVRALLRSNGYQVPD